MNSVALTVLAVSAMMPKPNVAKATTVQLTDAKTRQHVSLASLKGKYKAIFIDMFASWCGPCQAEMLTVNKLNSQYGSKGVAFIGLDVRDQWAAMQADVKRQHVNYRVLHDEPMQGGIMNTLGVQSIPMVIILDGKTLKEKGRWSAPGEAATSAQLSLLHSLGVR